MRTNTNVERLARAERVAIRGLGNWPFQPVIDLVNERERHPVTARQLGALVGVTRGCIQRWKRHGLTEKAADEVAIRLGVHPLNLWPDLYAAAVADDQDDVA